MNPVLVLQHIDGGGPAYFGEFLDRHGVGWELRRPDRGDPVPDAGALARYDGVCLCGGTQSLTAPEPWLDAEVALVRDAAHAGIPVIGHCLGGQVISAAFGGEVRRLPFEEFGWQRLQREDNAAAREWLRHAPEAPVCLQWHHDGFSLPDGGVPLLTGAHCRNQAFVIGDMLAMQFHVEITADVVRHWAVDLAHLIPPRSETVQTAADVLALMDENVALNRQLADSLYTAWLQKIA